MMNSMLTASPKPLVFGHRGYAAKAPENTLAAFALAIERGVPAVELDVQLSADGKAVIFHDFDLRRYTGKPDLVSDTTFEELRKIDAGGQFSVEFANERIPLLDELFTMAAGRLFFDLELKSRSTKPDALIREVMLLVHKHGLENHCVISSFNPFLLRRARRLRCGLPLGLIYSMHKDQPFWIRGGRSRWLAHCDFLKPHWPLVTNAGKLPRVPKGGQVWCWTANDPAAIPNLLRLGVSGFCSDDPCMVMETLSKLG